MKILTSIIALISDAVGGNVAGVPLKDKSLTISQLRSAQVVR